MSEPAQPTLEIRLFGAPEIYLNGEAVTELSAKTEALLFYLAVTRQPYLRTTLATLLWGEMSEKNASSNLRKAIQQLRKALPEHFKSELKLIRLVDDQTVLVDVVEFEKRFNQFKSEQDLASIEEATICYRNNFIDGFFVQNAPEFEAWQMRQQAQWRGMVLEALHALLDDSIAEKFLPRSISFARRIVEVEPWSEEAHNRLMELLVQDGQRGAALNQYELSRKILWDELEIAPPVAMTGLYQRLKNQNLSASAATPKPFTITSDFELVGREAEVKIIQERWRTLDGPHFILIAGESGIGKTRLAEELLMLTEQKGGRSARTRSHALEGRLAYGPVADWLRTESLKSGVAELDYVWLTEIARILPELLIEHSELLHPGPITDSWQRKRLFEALLYAFTQKRSKLLLVLDDLQWCDNDTLEWLQYFLETVEIPLLIIGTVRLQEVGREHPLHRICRQLERLDRFTRIDLLHLTSDSTLILAEQVAKNTIDPRISEHIFSDTLGNPLFVIECIRSGNSTDPISSEADCSLPSDKSPHGILPKMYSVIQSRLALLSSDATYVMQIGAIIGRAFDVGLLAHATNMTTESVFNALDELWQQRVIREVDNIHFDFNHDRIREVAYEEIGIVRKRLLHERTALALEKTSTSNVSAIAGEIAEHYYRAGMPDMTIIYCQKAADISKQLFSYSEAVGYLEKAISAIESLSETPRFAQTAIDLWYQLALAYVRVHEWGNELVASALDNTYELSMKVGSPFQQGRSLFGQHYFYCNRGEWQQSGILLQPHLKNRLTIKDPYLNIHLSNSCGVTFYHMGEPTQAIAYFDKAQSLADSSVEPSFEWFSSHPKVGALVRLANALGLAGYPDQARARAAESIQLVEDYSDIEQHFPVWDLSAMLYTFFDECEMVESLGQRLIKISLERQFQFYEREGRIFVAWAQAHRTGDARSCAQIIRQSVDAHRSRGIRMFEPYWRGMLAEALALMGDPEPALQEVDNALKYSNTSGNCYWDAQLLKLKGDYHGLLSSSGCKVESCYQQAIDTARDQKAKLLELRATNRLCRLWQKQGKTHEAHQLLTPIYNWFTEGFDTVDLIEAKTLLNEFAES